MSSAAAHVCLAAQPRTVNGTPDTLIVRGAHALLGVTAQLVDAIVSAVKGKGTAAAIKGAVDATAKRFGSARIAKPIERELLHGAMLGAMDAAFEADTGRAVPVERFSGTDTRFAARPLQDAIKSFLEKEPVTRDVFDAMEEDAKRRAFTVAGAANAEMVKTVKRELQRQLAVGADLNDFGKHAAKRFQEAGWVPANGSHVETVFRTNVMTAYSGGRVRQMAQPEVLSVRPYWQILGAGDGPPRQRPTHAAAHGMVLAADDPFWQKATPPFGYNCRCRLRSLSRAQGKGKVVDGSTIHGLPDPGFTSGMGELFPAGSPPPVDPNPKPANDPPPPQQPANDPPPVPRPANEGGSAPPPAPAPRAPLPAPPAPRPAPPRKPRAPRKPKPSAAPPPARSEPHRRRPGEEAPKKHEPIRKRLPKPPVNAPAPEPREPKPTPAPAPKPTPPVPVPRKPRKPKAAPQPVAAPDPKPQPAATPEPAAPQPEPTRHSPKMKPGKLPLTPVTAADPLSQKLDDAKVEYAAADTVTAEEKQAVARGLDRLGFGTRPVSNRERVARVELVDKVVPDTKTLVLADGLPERVGGMYFTPNLSTGGVLKVSVNEAANKLFLRKQKLIASSAEIPGNTQNIAQSLEEVIEMTTVHEYAHHLHMKEFDFDTKNEITKAFADAKRENVSIYADQDEFEWFAESVTAYRYYPRSWMEKRAPNALALVERILKANKLLTSITMAKTDSSELEPARPHPDTDQDLIDYCAEMAANRKPTRAEWQALMDKWQGRVNIESLLRRGSANGWLK